VIDILRALENEINCLLWSSMSTILIGLHNLMAVATRDATASFDAFLEFGKQFISVTLNKVQWEGFPDEGVGIRALRGLLIGLLDFFSINDETVIAEARRRFQLHWDQPDVLSNEYKLTVYRIVLINGGEDEYEQILSAYRKATNDQVRKNALSTLGASRSRALKLRTLDWTLKSGEVKLQDYYFCFSTVARDMEGAEIAWEYYKEVRKSFAYTKVFDLSHFLLPLEL
jgi:aminopeptidase N